MNIAGNTRTMKAPSMFGLRNTLPYRPCVRFMKYLPVNSESLCNSQRSKNMSQKSKRAITNTTAVSDRMKRR